MSTCLVAASDFIASYLLTDSHTVQAVSTSKDLWIPTVYYTKYLANVYQIKCE